MPVSRTASRRLVVPVLLGAIGTLASCSAMQRHRAAEIALFPVNVVPDILSNTLVMLTLPVWMPFCDQKDGNQLPILWLFTPFVGPLMGVWDAWYGYPFWDPVVLDEHRSYEPDATAPSTSGGGAGG